MCTDIVIYLQHFDQSIISSPSAPLSSNNSITSFLSLFWSLISAPLVFFSLIHFCAWTESSLFCVMFFFICGHFMFGPPSPVAVSRTRSVSESESSSSTFSLPSSFTAPTFLKSFYQGSLGSLNSLPDSGSLKRWEGGAQATPLA